MYIIFFCVIFSFSMLIFDTSATLRTIQIEGTLECCQDDSTTTTVSTIRTTGGRFVPVTASTPSTAATTPNTASTNNLASTISANDSTQIRGKRHIVKRNVGCEPIHNATIQLWELDPLPFDDDDLINRADVSENGKFAIRGSEDEKGAVDFLVKIFHTCGLGNSGNVACRKISGMEFKLEGQVYNKELTNVVWNLNQATQFDGQEC